MNHVWNTNPSPATPKKSTNKPNPAANPLKKVQKALGSNNAKPVPAKTSVKPDEEYKKKCIFVTHDDVTCDSRCFGNNTVCAEHKALKCNCGSPAIKYCGHGLGPFDTLCKEPLCGNRYCELTHNEKQHNAIQTNRFYDAHYCGN